MKCGFLFIDGDHSFEGVLADVVAHWNALEDTDGKPGLAAFHDALPNENFKWRDADRSLHRFWIRLKNKFRIRQKAEIAPDYEVGVNHVCQKLLNEGVAERWGAASSVLVLRKLGNLPADFRAQCEAEWANGRQPLRVEKGPTIAIQYRTDYPDSFLEHKGRNIV
jgi:hypothetical protein